jgi:hypothetical protein
MMNRLAWLGVGILLVTTPSWANWEVAADSRVQFVSIKQNTVGEISHFERVSGAVSQDGQVDIRVSLDSVETMVGIRNQRMKEMLFEVGVYPQASITAKLDPEALTLAASGYGGEITTDIKIDLHGASVTKSAKLQVTPMKDGLGVSTSEPILIHAAEFGLEPGVAALQEVAGLLAISRVVPVTVSLRLVKSDAAPADA